MRTVRHLCTKQGLAVMLGLLTSCATGPGIKLDLSVQSGPRIELGFIMVPAASTVTNTP